MPNEITPGSDPQKNVARAESVPAQPYSPPVTTDQGTQGFSPELFQKFLDLQGRELDVREKEIAREQAKQGNAHDFSMVAVKHQAAFYMQEGQLRHGRFKLGTWVVAGIVLCTFVFLAALVLNGHERIAEEFLKDAVLILGGGAGGYGYAKRKSNASQQQTPTHDQPSTEDE